MKKAIVKESSPFSFSVFAHYCLITNSSSFPCTFYATKTRDCESVALRLFQVSIVISSVRFRSFDYKAGVTTRVEKGALD